VGFGAHGRLDDGIWLGDNMLTGTRFAPIAHHPIEVAGSLRPGLIYAERQPRVTPQREKVPIRERCLLPCVLLLVLPGPVAAQQEPDLNYNPPIPRPAYEAGAGPRVAIDEAHHNFHTVDGRYGPFAGLLRRDGYRVEGFRSLLSARSLEAVDVLVIANPLNERNVEDWSLPTPSAFTRDEIAAVRTWIDEGGSLFLIADHMPFSGAAGELAVALGVKFSNGYARPGHQQRGAPDMFNGATGLKECVVTRGRTEDERIAQVATFTGSAFTIPEAAIPVLVFGAESVSLETRKAPGITENAPEIPIEGWCQGALLKLHNGRVAVFGEAAMFSAQLAGPQQLPVGMNAPEAQENHQLLLNVMHWLTLADGMSD
jgi:hypothetical protein